MRLNDSQKQIIIKFLQEKWKLKGCPVCGQQQTYDLAEQVYQLTEYPAVGRMGGSVVAPVIPVTCRNCGNTLLVNALIAKVPLNNSWLDEERAEREEQQ